jgi:MFS family permease
MMTEGSRPRFFYGYVVVAVAFLLMFIMWGAYYSFGIFFEPLLAEFGWTRAMTSAAFSLSFILTGVFGVFAGRLTDRLGPRMVLTVTGFFLGLGYLLISITDALWQFYLFYGLIVALGMSSSVIPLQSTVARWFARRRGMMNAVVVAGIGVGMLVIPLVASTLIASRGWRSSYVIVGVAALVLIMISAQFLRRDPHTMGLKPYGQDEAGLSADLYRTGFTLPEAIRAPQFWLLTVATLCFTMAEGTTLVHIVPHAVGMGIQSTSAALIISIIGGVSIGGRLLAGSGADRIGNKMTWVLCLALMSVSFFWLLITDELWMFYLFAIIFGLGYGGLSVLISPMVAEYFGLSSHGVIMGVVIMFGGTAGMAIGPVIAGYIHDVTGSYQLAFIIYTGISVVGLILTSFLKPTRLMK